jgi:hypothetical protein
MKILYKAQVLAEYQAATGFDCSELALSVRGITPAQYARDLALCEGWGDDQDWMSIAGGMIAGGDIDAITASNGVTYTIIGFLGGIA